MAARMTIRTLLLAGLLVSVAAAAEGRAAVAEESAAAPAPAGAAAAATVGTLLDQVQAPAEDMLQAQMSSQGPIDDHHPQQQGQEVRQQQQQQQQQEDRPPVASFWTSPSPSPAAEAEDAAPASPTPISEPGPGTPWPGEEPPAQQQPRRKDPAKQRGKEKTVHPRIDIAEISEMADSNPYKLVMLMAWHELTTSKDTSDPLGLFALAGVHGQSWSYNNQRPRSSSGEDFGAWHRTYMLQFEKGLIKAAQTAVGRLSDAASRRKYLRVAKTIRAPYLDWTSGHVPSILTASSVMVPDPESGTGLTSISNPFLNYRYPQYVGDGRGSSVTRSFDWSSALVRSAGSLSSDMSRFIQSQSWSCTFQPGGFSGGFMRFNRGSSGGRGCPGTLEGSHNNVHNIIGGTRGEMATVKWAGFDPLFWLHHCQIDRMLWLFQNNGGGWTESSSYEPFTVPADLQNLHSIGAHGYTFRDAMASGLSSSSRRRQLLAHPDALPSELPVQDAGTEVGSPAALAAVKRALEAMSGGYSGYSWLFQLKQLNRGQLGQTVHVHLFLAGHLSREAQPLPGSTDAGLLDANALRQRSDYCGSVSGFNDFMDMAPGAEGPAQESIAIDSCLRAAGVDLAAAAPADPADRAKGPAAPIVRPADFVLLALAADGRDVSASFDFGKTAIGWTVPVPGRFSREQLQVAPAVGTAQGTSVPGAARPGLLSEGAEVVGLVGACFE